MNLPQRDEFVGWVKSRDGRWRAVAYGTRKQVSNALMTRAQTVPLVDMAVLPEGERPDDRGDRGRLFQ